MFYGRSSSDLGLPLRQKMGYDVSGVMKRLFFRRVRSPDGVLCRRTSRGRQRVAPTSSQSRWLSVGKIRGLSILGRRRSLSCEEATSPSEDRARCGSQQPEQLELPEQQEDQGSPPSATGLRTGLLPVQVSVRQKASDPPSSGSRWAGFCSGRVPQSPAASRSPVPAAPARGAERTEGRPEASAPQRCRSGSGRRRSRPWSALEAPAPEGYSQVPEVEGALSPVPMPLPTAEAPALSCLASGGLGLGAAWRRWPGAAARLHCRAAAERQRSRRRGDCPRKAHGEGAHQAVPPTIERERERLMEELERYKMASEDQHCCRHGRLACRVSREQEHVVSRGRALPASPVPSNFSWASSPSSLVKPFGATPQTLSRFPSRQGSGSELGCSSTIPSASLHSLSSSSTRLSHGVAGGGTPSPATSTAVSRTSLSQQRMFASSPACSLRSVPRANLHGAVTSPAGSTCLSRWGSSLSAPVPGPSPAGSARSALLAGSGSCAPAQRDVLQPPEGPRLQEAQTLLEEMFAVLPPEDSSCPGQRGEHCRSRPRQRHDSAPAAGFQMPAFSPVAAPPTLAAPAAARAACEAARSRSACRANLCFEASLQPLNGCMREHVPKKRTVQSLWEAAAALEGQPTVSAEQEDDRGQEQEPAACPETERAPPRRQPERTASEPPRRREKSGEAQAADRDFCELLRAALADSQQALADSQQLATSPPQACGSVCEEEAPAGAGGGSADAAKSAEAAAIDLDFCQLLQAALADSQNTSSPVVEGAPEPARPAWVEAAPEPLTADDTPSDLDDFASVRPSSEGSCASPQSAMEGTLSAWAHVLPCFRQDSLPEQGDSLEEVVLWLEAPAPLPGPLELLGCKEAPTSPSAALSESHFNNAVSHVIL